MRRTEQEFKAEVLRRSEQYRTEQKKRRRKIANTTLCCLMVFCGIFLMRPLLMAGGGSAESAAMEMPAAELERNEMAYAAEDVCAEAQEEAQPEIHSSTSTRSKPGTTDGTWDMIPMVMIKGVLYLDTGCDSDAEGRCGVMDGQITSSVNGSEHPTEDDQSNFGTGYGYQYGAIEGTVEIYMNGAWRIFATEEVRSQMQFSE